MRAKGLFDIKFSALLAAALLFSLARDVFPSTMLPGDVPLGGLPPFILGLGSFLIAHVFSTSTLFKQGQDVVPQPARAGRRDAGGQRT